MKNKTRVGGRTGNWRGQSGVLASGFVMAKAPPDPDGANARMSGYLLASVVLRFQTVSDMPPEPGAGLLILS